MRSILLIFIISYFQTYAQEQQSKKSTHLIGTEISFGLRNNESFHGINYSIINKRFLFSSGINLGVKSSYFQRNIYPQLNLKSTFLLFPLIQKENKSSYSLGPMLNLNSGFQRIENIHSFTDILLGYELFVGKKIRFNHSFGAGLYLESFKDQFSNRQFLNALNFQLSIGINYAFN